MSFDNHPNLAYSTVATIPSPATSGGSLAVAAGEGARFGTPPFQISIWPAGATPTSANTEIARCTARSTDTLTITRAQEGTTARSIGVGDQIAASITAKTITDVEVAVEAREVVLIESGGSYPSRPDSTICPAGMAMYQGADQPSDWLSGDRWIKL